PDGRWIVSASLDHTMKVWNVESGRAIRTLEGHTGSVNGCAVSPNGRWIVSVSYDTTLKVWELRTGQCLTTLAVEGSLARCTWHPDSQRLVAVGAGGVYFLRFVV
ncbi:MAG: WD40 repeat domain-containing protein, partial [Anaerolineae bacterium]|nr:WD40 repeat domain-containing protein [Anaerolineae bacterium]